MNISKIFLLSLALVPSFGFAQAAKEPISYTADVYKVAEAATVQTINVTAGEHFIVKIAGFKCGAYWQAYRDNNVLDMLKSEKVILADDVGNPKYETHFTFKVLKPGQTDLSFKTVFMSPTSPNRAADFTVIVE